MKEEKEQKWKGFGKLKYLLAGVFVLCLTAGFMLELGDGTKAADNEPYIKIDVGVTKETNAEGAVIYTMNQKQVTAQLENIGEWITDTDVTVDWFLDASLQANPTAENDYLKIETTGTSGLTTTVNVFAKNVGQSLLYAKIKKAGAYVKEIKCVINVVFKIDNNTGHFLEYNQKDCLFMTTYSAAGANGNAPYYEASLDLVFGDKNAATWTTSDKYVLEMLDSSDGGKTNKSGKVRATGAGRTELTVTYTDNTDKKHTYIVTVYVIPSAVENGVTETDGSDHLVKNLAIHSGKEPIYTNANVDSNNASIKQKMSWAVYKDEKIIADSEGLESDLIEVSSKGTYSSLLDVTGKAGDYVVRFYPVGMYTTGMSEADVAKLNQMFAKDNQLNLKIYSECKDMDIILQIGDSFDVRKSFNLPETGFNIFLSSENEEKAGTNGDLILAKQLSTMPIKVEAAITGSDLAPYLDPTSSQTKFTIRVQIVNGFSLDRTSVSITKGSTLKLKMVNGDPSEVGKATWSSSNETFVKVDQNGVITGVKATEGEPIRITLEWEVLSGESKGTIRTASCLVVVTESVDKIELDPKEMIVEVDGTRVINAKYTPANISSVQDKFVWNVMDPEILEITPSEDKKSAQVKGVKSGTTIVTLLNKDNSIMAYCEVTVRTPIKTLTLDKKELTIKTSRELFRLKPIYTPADATATDLIWTIYKENSDGTNNSGDTSVIRMDENDPGLFYLEGPGTAKVLVQPAYNPNGVSAMCIVNVISSATDFALNKTSLTLEQGQKEQLKAVLTPNGSSTTLTWQSMNTAVASVAADGTVTAVGPGQTYIVATSSEGKLKQCLVTVTKKASGIKLSTYNLLIGVGEKIKVTATPNPATSTEKKFTWTSKDASIASVNNEGEVTGVAAGSTIILVKTTGGSVEYLYVTVQDQVKGLKLNHTTRTVTKGKTATLKPVFTPANVSNKNVTWASSDESVATIDKNGKVKGIKGGATIITCISDDGGFIATCLVKVVEPITSLKLNKKSYTLGVGKTFRLKATLKTTSATNPKLKWTTTNKKVATVSSNGNVRGKKVGTCTIKVTTTDGSKKSASCKVKVIRPVTKISLNKHVVTVVKGKSATVKATVKPSNATSKSVSWSSSDKSVAVVIGGKITGMNAGTATITAKAKDNSGKSAVCYVTVIDEIPVSSIVLSAQNITMVKGQKQKVNYSIVPSNTTDKVKFDSDNKSVATVSSSGTITAKRAGLAHITIVTTSGKQATVNVTVIGLNKTSMTMEQYDTETLYVDGASSGITWFSSAPSVATVVNGTVVARKPGTAYIYAKYNGISLSCRVVVTKIN